MRTVWLSSRALTTVVTVNDDDRIVESHAPITWKFVGQPLANLEWWMHKQGNLITHTYKECWIHMATPQQEVDLTTSYNIMVTGHRKLGTENPYDPDNPVALQVKEALKDELVRITRFTPLDGKRPIGITGMALGVDQLFAEACNDLYLPWVAFIPCLGQDLKWKAPSQKRYADLLHTAAGEVWPSGEVPFTPAVMHDRNTAMVDNADLVLAVWHGGKGGTAHAVSVATARGRRVRQLDPSDLDAGWFDLHPAGAFPVEESIPADQDTPSP